MGTLRIATEDKLHSAESAAELLGVKASTIRWWWSIGKIRRVRVGTRLTRVRESELLALINTDSPLASTRPMPTHLAPKTIA